MHDGESENVVRCEVVNVNQGEQDGVNSPPLQPPKEMADKEQGAGVLYDGAGENVNGNTLSDVNKGVQQWVKSPPLQSPQEVPDVEQGAGGLSNGEGECDQQYDPVSMENDETKLQCDSKEMLVRKMKNENDCYHCSRVRRRVNGNQIERMRVIQYDHQQSASFEEIDK